MKNKAGIFAALLALDLEGILIKIREGRSTKLLDRVPVLATRGSDKHSSCKGTRRLFDTIPRVPAVLVRRKVFAFSLEAGTCRHSRRECGSEKVVCSSRRPSICLI